MGKCIYLYLSIYLCSSRIVIWLLESAAAVESALLSAILVSCFQAEEGDDYKDKDKDKDKDNADYKEEVWKHQVN